MANDIQYDFKETNAEILCRMMKNDSIYSNTMNI